MVLNCSIDKQLKMTVSQKAINRNLKKKKTNNDITDFYLWTACLEK
jgi:hypothetical protein